MGKLLKLIMLDTRVIGRDLQNATDALVRPCPCSGLFRQRLACLKPTL